MAQHENIQSRYNHVLKYTGLFGGVQGLTMLVSIVRNKLVSVLVGAVGLGMADLLNRTVLLISNSSNLGISFSAVRQLSELQPYRDDLSAHQQSDIAHCVQVIRFWSVVTGLFGMLLCMALSPLLGRWTMHSYSSYLLYLWLSPMILCIAVAGGELAVLKAFRRLSSIAVASVQSALATLCITVPFYYFYRLDGIVPALLLSSVCNLLIFLRRSLRCVPWNISLCRARKLFRDGRGIVRLGGAYILAALAGDGADVAIRSFINNSYSAEQVGFYTAGFTLTVTYARMVFVAMDSDFYPRLSALFAQPEQRNELINRQVELSLLLMVPFLTTFLCLLPVVLPLLYTHTFMPVYPMVCCSVFYMFFKSITTPVAYMPLAKGDAVMYTAMELFYDFVFVLLVIQGYKMGGLVGAGIALSVSNLLDMVCILGVYTHKYHYHTSGEVRRYGLILGCFLVCSVASSFLQEGVWRIAIQILVCVLSIGYSYYIIKNRTTLMSELKARLKSKKGGRA